MLVLMLK